MTPKQVAEKVESLLEKRFYDIPPNQMVVDKKDVEAVLMALYSAKNVMKSFETDTIHNCIGRTIDWVKAYE